ncbi:hypothetical protein CTA1_7517 [Colletotrichum tanaceti]|uniref:Uncharacterized protein n=1 Tax=Colletotrichum tanaceti TaxID=1306861 RepID=A0A4U6XCC7_9PEZI|nr:hypothetical protein CTA1_7517 [Colletotrichum tanaceti]
MGTLAHLDGLLPAAEALGSLVLGDGGLEDGAALEVDVLELVEALPHAHRKACRDGRAKGRRLTHTGAVDRDTDEVGLVAHAAVNGELRQGGSAVLLHGVQDGLGLEAGGLEGGAGDVAALGVGGDAEDGAAGVVDPVGGEEAAEGGDKGAAAVVLDGLGEGAELGGGLDEAEVVDEELDAGAGDGDAALEGVHGLAGPEVEGDGGQQAVGGDDGLGADVVEQEAAGAVRVLGEAGGEALLADEGGGLVAQAAGDLCAAQQGVVQRAVGLGVRGADDLGELDLCRVDAEPVDEVVVVLQRVDVHEHGARGVGGVRDVDVAGDAAVELVDQPGVDGAKGQHAALVGVLDLGHVLEQPEELADGGVRRQGQAAPLGELAGAEPLLQPAHEVLGARVGPDDGVVQGLAGGPVPEHGCLPLVGDADRLDLVARVALGLERLDGAVDALLDRRDELLGVMLVPAVA